MRCFLSSAAVVVGLVCRAAFASRARRGLAATLAALTLIVGGASAQCEVAKLLASDGAAGDLFGLPVAVSRTTAIIGAYEDDDNGDGSGSAYLFDTTTGQQLFKLLPSDGAEDDWFGGSVGISGTTAIIGAYGDDDNGSVAGSAYLFDTSTGQQLFKLLPSDGAASDRFGWSVGISGTTAIVGVRYDDDNGNNSGSAYLFDTTTGQQLFKLLPSDGAERDEFGFSVAISGITAIIGAHFDDDTGENSGSAYVFDTTTGQQLFKLLPSDGAEGDWFGGSVALSGTTAIIGASRDDANGERSGSAYLFDTTTGQQLFKLLPSDGAEGDEFGWSVAISGSTAIVGAYGDDGDSGSVYLFDTTTGQQLFKLLPHDRAANDRFGWSVAVSGTTAVVGAHYDDDNGRDSGSAYVFDLICELRLRVVASCPSGGPIQVSWSGATPNGQAALLFALSEGTFAIPNNRPCAGVVLGLGSSQLQIAWQGTSNSSGEKTLNANAGPSACGGYLQLLDLTTCGTSNVVQVH